MTNIIVIITYNAYGKIWLVTIFNIHTIRAWLTRVYKCDNIMILLLLFTRQLKTIIVFQHQHFPSPSSLSDSEPCGNVTSTTKIITVKENDLHHINSLY